METLGQKFATCNNKKSGTTWSFKHTNNSIRKDLTNVTKTAKVQSANVTMSDWIDLFGVDLLERVTALYADDYRLLGDYF